MKYKTFKNKAGEKTLFEKIWGGILTVLCSLEIICLVGIICLSTFFNDSGYKKPLDFLSYIGRNIGVLTLIFIEINVVAIFYDLKLKKNKNIPFIISIIMILTTFIGFVLNLINFN